MRAIVTGHRPESTVTLFTDEGRKIAERTRDAFEDAFSSLCLFINVRMSGLERAEAFLALSEYPTGAKAAQDELARIRGGYEAQRVADAEAKERERRKQGIPEVRGHR